jgi:hypothetical protein
MLFLVPGYGGPIHDEMALWDLDMGCGTHRMGSMCWSERINTMQGVEEKK